MMSTLSEAIDELVHQGFTEHFGVRGHQLRGFESGATFEANGDYVVVRGLDRGDRHDAEVIWSLGPAH